MPHFVSDDEPTDLEHSPSMKVMTEVEKVVLYQESGDSSKKDFGKTRYSLIPRDALRALAELYTLGAHKYQPRGWETGMDWSRIWDALERHFNNWLEGEDYDQIDGQHHLIAVAWCAFALYCYQTRGVGTDDRP